MKINDALKSQISQNVDRAALDKTNAVKTESANTKQAEKVQVDNKAASGSVTISARATQLQAMATKVEESNVYDAVKVEAIKSAISDGQFKVSSEKIADGLIATVRDLLTTQKP
jgi:negative regulator of flagellin synthesis FlgM